MSSQLDILLSARLTRSAYELRGKGGWSSERADESEGTRWVVSVWLGSNRVERVDCGVNAEVVERCQRWFVRHQVAVLLAQCSTSATWTVGGLRSSQPVIG